MLLVSKRQVMNPSKNRRNQDRFTPGTRPMKAKFSPSRLRIVAGDLGGRKIDYDGDPATRPMKERTREAAFSLLGGHLNGYQVVDLFAGTGILAFESVSRGAARATLMELSRSVVTTIISNAMTLSLQDVVDVLNIDTLRWMKGVEKNTANWPDRPWVVFCCPPYRMWEGEKERLAEGIREMYKHSPVGSQFVCEAEEHFDLENAITGLDWDVRKYTPAKLGICRKRDTTQA